MSSRPLDEEALAALTLFNTYLEADAERRKHEQEVKSAKKKKKRAAAAVRRLKERKASAADLVAAEAAYRETVDSLNRLRQQQPDTGSENSRTGSEASSSNNSREPGEASQDST